MKGCLRKQILVDGETVWQENVEGDEGDWLRHDTEVLGLYNIQSDPNELRNLAVTGRQLNSA